MEKPLLNVLVRTSNRPNHFARCYKSIRLQTYKNVRLIVSYDDETTKEYVKGYNIDALVGFDRLEDWSKIPPENFHPGYSEKAFPPNGYFNKMMGHTKPGYILYLDDDNLLSSPKSLEEIAGRITGSRQMLLWRVQFPGYLVPDNYHFRHIPGPCQVDTAGFAFHTDYIKHAIWDGYNYSDFRTALNLFLHIPEKVWINEPLICTHHEAGKGNRKDLRINKNEIA